MPNGQNPINSTNGAFESPPDGAVRPPVQDDVQEYAATESFSSPETGAAEEAAATPEVRGLESDDRLLSIKQAIETQLMQRARGHRRASR